MNVNSPATSRPDYYDRNPVPRVESASTSHGAASSVLTTRWTRTIAAGKKAYVEFLQCYAFNNSVTALDGQALAQVTADGAVINDATVLIGATGAAGGRAAAEIGGAGFFATGTVFVGRNQCDNSAVGTAVSTRMTCKLTEFDA